jgi:ribosome-associated toxin RatA of RatAB toxin-antitoxin module
MDIHFNHTEPVDAPAETLFEVITDYAGCPRFNPAVVKTTVVAKDQNGAELLAEDNGGYDRAIPPRVSRSPADSS